MARLEVPDSAHRCSGLFEPLQARKVGNKRSLENVENILKLEEREAPDRRRERKGHQERLQEVERGI